MNKTQGNMVRKFNVVFFVFSIIVLEIQGQTSIRLNQLGYKEESIKIAVMLSKNKIGIKSFSVINALTKETVFNSTKIEVFNNWEGFASSIRLNFSELEKIGSYYLQVENIKSPIFKIGNDVYNGSADFLLNYMRQQRCGYNPFLKDSCHTQDGFIIYSPGKDSSHIDVKGGWHDASDYLQYVTTSANATYQMMFAYEQNPKSFQDNYDKNGEQNLNGIPDILDEAKWGIDWLLKMNPDDSIMYNQIADDRDHLGFRLPNKDKISYGKNSERPVYFCDGKPQGIFKFKNRTDGIASTAGKYASAFALAAKLFTDYDSTFSTLLLQKAISAFHFGRNHPGVCQTAPCRSPYFYEEENYSDDMELAASQLFDVTNDIFYLDEAIKYARLEKITPWIGSDTARHYQWYPFVNLGHFILASKQSNYFEEFKDYLKEGLQRIYDKGKRNVFFNGIPFIWCSNNLIVAALTQIQLYKKIATSHEFDEMEAMLRDWLFGCNPWGTSMIVGLPNYGDYPSDPHSAFTHLGNYKINGGLVDGPVYSTIFNKLIGITLYNGDEYKNYQNDFVVYHDDYGDYSTNEPTMDGTASLTFYLSSLESELCNYREKSTYDNGAIVRGDSTRKEIALIFSGHEFAEGGVKILETLTQQNIKGSFFFTGDFYRNKQFKDLIIKIRNESHYLGVHSNKHLLYCDWVKRDSLLITKEDFVNDLQGNYSELLKFGITPDSAKYFLPPFEWYNNETNNWANQLGITLINYSPNTFTNADYSIPSMGKSYRSSNSILDKLIEIEKTETLNGKILLVHIGTHPERADKFYNYLEEIILRMKVKGYKFLRIDELLNTKRRNYEKSN